MSCCFGKMNQLRIERCKVLRVRILDYGGLFRLHVLIRGGVVSRGRKVGVGWGGVKGQEESHGGGGSHLV